MHKLLLRQLKRHDIWELIKPLSEETKEPIKKLLAAISTAYQQADQDRELLERSMDLMSSELNDRYNQLQKYVEEKKKQDEKILHHAYHDNLTGLPNRLLLVDRLEHAISYAQRDKLMVAVLFIDLDHFKKVNDTCGHNEGDNLLIEFSQRIKSCLRKHETIARIGGDEFVILLEGIPQPSVATQLCERILDEISYPFQLSTHQFHIHCSIGVSIYPKDADDGEELIRRADMAMYHAKELGRNNFQYFNAYLEKIALNFVDVENKLRRAIDSNLLNLHFQPQLDTKSKKIVGVEALIRWFDIDNRRIPPDEFIPIAEQTGIISEIDRWVLDSACSQLKKWKDVGINNLKMSINLSARNLLDAQITQTILNAADKHQVSCHLLEIEITETILMENLRVVKNTLDDIRKLGVNIAVDDFGTGYSSLSYLHNLPIDHLKIDRSFILKLRENSTNSSIVNTIISLGNNLGLDVIAEGVEEKAALDYLEKMGCEFVQGFYLYPPMSSEEITSLLLEQKKRL